MAAGVFSSGGDGDESPSVEAGLAMEGGVGPVSSDDPQGGAEEDAPRDPGVPRMTSQTLLSACVKSEGYRSPELNDVLVLSYKGFNKIENLAAYSNVKSLFLECNGIRRLENLEVMPKLVSLYLQSNNIQLIENLERLPALMYLNLAHNSIALVGDLSGLPRLETLNLASNKFSDVAGLHGLGTCPSLKSVDISANYIEDGEGLVDFCTKMFPVAECLYLKNNPCSRSLVDYRRRMISSVSTLRWLDDRPVTDMERVGCEAWSTGGKEAELEAKRAVYWQEQGAKTASFTNYRRIQSAAREKHQRAKDDEEGQVASHSEALAEFAATGRLLDGWAELPAQPSAPPVVGDALGAKQAKLRAKVDALLAKRRARHTPPADAACAPPMCAPPERDEAAAVGDQDDSGTQAEGEEPGDSGGEVGDDVAKPFEWTGFRDRRLGRLVADFRYNFHKAAAALSDEFQCSIDHTSCRERYKVLSTPKKKTSEDQGGAMSAAEASRGRAKDGPPPDPSAVKEVSDWWTRKLSKGSLVATPGAAGNPAPSCASGEVAATLPLSRAPPAATSFDDEEQEEEADAKVAAQPVGAATKAQVSVQDLLRELGAVGRDEFIPPAQRGPEIQMKEAAAQPVGAASKAQVGVQDLLPELGAGGRDEFVPPARRGPEIQKKEALGRDEFLPPARKGPEIEKKKEAVAAVMARQTIGGELQELD